MLLAAYIIAILGSLVIVITISYWIIETLKSSKKSYEIFKEYLANISIFNTEYNQIISDYVTKNQENQFLERWSELYTKTKKKHFSKKFAEIDQINDFIKAYESFHERIYKLNFDYFDSNNERFNELLSNIDGKSLDLQQRRVVLSKEDRILVLAGAGSGKTLTIAAKVKYLYEIEHISPEEILLISFTTKAADEMTERIQKKLNIPVQAVTFHKLGLDIITKSLGYRPDVNDNLEDFVENFFENELINHPELVQSLMEYFAYYLDIPENMDNYKSLGDLYEQEKSADLETLKSKYDKEQFIQNQKEEKTQNLTTLNGEHVKSIEETKIANFLFMHGVKYEYEKLYPFESDDPTRKAYRPDFYLTDYDIYLEHFGISEDFRCPWLSQVEEDKYIDGIFWKRDFHEKNGTKLIETYSYYTKKGELLPKLEELLLENNIKFKSLDFIDIFETIYAKKSNKYFSEFIKLCCTFITLFKSNGYGVEKFEELRKKTSSWTNNFIYQRNSLFLNIAKTIYIEYQDYLKDAKSVDFSDMIIKASEKVNEGAEIPHYKYVIVDEFQDISQSRFNLLYSIIQSTGSKLLCVGDDWQSIYRFAGSDISIFTCFDKYFHFAEILKIEKTYRNSQELIDQASNFVLKNSFQLNKELKSDKQLSYPLVFWGYDKDPNDSLKQIMNKIITDFGSEKSILLLGRINYDLELLLKSGLFSVKTVNRQQKLIYLPSPETPVSFLTVHKSKGLEADNVVLINFKNEKLGFPNKIADDEVLNLVLLQDEKFPFAEERRLFYVAITRTRNRTFILTDNSIPSLFFREFNESDTCCFVNIKAKTKNDDIKCPRCKTGNLLKVEHDGKSFIGCSNFPKCTYSVHDTSIMANPKKCPSCGGFLIKRHDKNKHYFVGCTNYPYCKHTEKL